MRPRARDLGIAFAGTPGAFNAITDVAGVSVGYTTIVRGDGALVVGEGPVRTGVTAVHPRGLASHEPVLAGWCALNGNGELTGTTWIDESGFLEGPVMLTNTHSVGIVSAAVVAWQARTGRLIQPYSYPVVGETYDGRLHDINGSHVTAAHALAAIEGASEGPIAEGNVGGGTGMICFGFKGGTGTASRRVEVPGAGVYTVGVLVQANFGTRDQLVIAGVPVGREIPGDSPAGLAAEQGSIIVVVATDAPLLSHQLERVARRAGLGIGRTGGIGGNGSGDIMLAFSTANPGAATADPIARIEMLANSRITPLFDATIAATEEAIVNALVAAETMRGIDDHVAPALPHDGLREAMARYRRRA